MDYKRTVEAMKRILEMPLSPDEKVKILTTVFVQCGGVPVEFKWSRQIPNTPPKMIEKIECLGFLYGGYIRILVNGEPIRGVKYIPAGHGCKEYIDIQ